MTVPAIPAVFDVGTAGWADIIAGWGQPWTAYTPVLTASTTNPNLGAGGSALGIYMQIGKTVLCQFAIRWGTSGTNAGSGNYFISLPVTPTNFSTLQQYGTGLISCAGLFTSLTLLADASQSVADLFYVTTAVNGAAARVTNAAPGVSTANDTIRGTLIYQAA